MNRTLLLLVACLTIAAACTVSANVGDLEVVPAEAGADTGATNDGGSSDGPSDAPSGQDADASTPIDAGCGVTFPQEASFVDIAVTVGVPPSYQGGTIVTGTYELVSMRAFSSGTSGTMQVRETLVVRGSSKAGAFDRLTEARNATGSFKAYPLHGETSTWEAPSGPSFFQTPECPQKGFQGTGRYEASGDTLAVFDDKDVIERKYRRIR